MSIRAKVKRRAEGLRGADLAEEGRDKIQSLPSWSSRTEMLVITCITLRRSVTKRYTRPEGTQATLHHKPGPKGMTYLGDQVNSIFTGERVW